MEQNGQKNESITKEQENKMMIMIDPMFAHWVTITPIVLAVIVGIIARRVRYREEVKECIEWSKKSVHPLITKGSKRSFF